MLRTLRVQNYALIDDLTIEFSPGLNVLTGETGAGKSIIIGALSAVLGEKSDAGVIRTGKDVAVVEAGFVPGSARPAVDALLADLALDAADSDELVVRRRLARTGKSSALVNDGALSAGALKRLGDLLVDLHGQHEHQSLLKPELHRQVLDDFAGLTGAVAELAGRFREYGALRDDLAGLRAELKAKQERRDLTDFQLRELVAAQLNPDDIEELNREKELLETAEKRLTLVRELKELLAEGEGAIQEQLSNAQRRMESLAQLDDRLARLNADLQQAYSLTDETWRELVKYHDAIDARPGRLDEVNARLYHLEELLRKYGGRSAALDRAAIEKLIAHRDRLAREAESVELDESRIRELEPQVVRLRGEMVKRARHLSAARRKAGALLETKLAREFADLGLNKARLAVSQEPVPDENGLVSEAGRRYRLDATGMDDIEFRFSANPGEELKPLHRIASGGELSRIMLALKSVLAGQDRVPVMVFDEVDVGISGRIAEAVGKKLSRIAAGRQVICITHLPQIARFAPAHFRVSKQAQGGRTVTRIVQLTPEERVEELARMMAGAEVTKTARAHARELLDGARG